MTVLPPATRRRRRYLTAAEKIRKESALGKRNWSEFRQACKAFYGATYGETVYEWIQRGEHDFAFASEKLLGVKALPWQVAAWDALEEHFYIPASAPNAGGKTTGYAIIDMLAGFYRKWSTPEWGTKEYRIIHLAPEAAQANELNRKISAFLEERSSEQMYRVPGGYEARPCLLSPFFKEAQPDDIHDGWEILGGSSTITCRPSTFKMKGTDGTDPALFTWDELRHEKKFDEALNSIVLPRFLRVPFGRLLMFFTPLFASVELLAAYNRGLSEDPNDRDWFSITLDDLRAANRTISDETHARAERNISERYKPMVLRGKPIQPEGAKFSKESVEEAFIGTTEPAWLSDIVGIRQRVTTRCVVCAKIKAGETLVFHFNGERKHPIIGWVDPASSAVGADSIVATAWDLQPPSWPVRWAECVYVDELPIGTKVQRVAAHIAILSMVIHGVAGFDANSALGHNIIDELADFPDAHEVLEGMEGLKHVEKGLRDRLKTIELMEEPDVAPIGHNSKKEKDADVDYLSGLLDLGKLGLHFHMRTKVQMTNYVRKDTGIAQDFVMAQVGAAILAKAELPDMFAERARRDKGGRVRPSKAGEDDLLLGVGTIDDPYFDLPDGVGDAFGAIDAYGMTEGPG